MDLPDPRIKQGSPALQVDSLPNELSGKPICQLKNLLIEEAAKILFFFQFTCIFKGFPCGLTDKESACNVGDLGSIPGLGRSPGEGKGYLFQYSGLENSMDFTVHGVAKSQT